MSRIDRNWIFRAARLMVFTLIACGVVLLIPAAPGQTGGATSSAVAGSGASGRAIPWRPFIDPIDMHSNWYWLLIPMAFGVSVVYKAVRMHELRRYWSQVVYMTAQIVVAMILLGAATYIVVIQFAPFIASR